MRRLGVLAAVVGTAAAALVLMSPVSAAAAPAVTPALATCTTGFVDATAGVDVYSGPDSFRIIDTITVRFRYDCFGFELGRRYTACGVSDGNGWIQVTGDMGKTGFAPQACFVAVS
jgi:sarcosine oxidase gamma subunit